jgi:hypothetical protein
VGWDWVSWYCGHYWLQMIGDDDCGEIGGMSRHPHGGKKSCAFNVISGTGILVHTERVCWRSNDCVNICFALWWCRPLTFKRKRLVEDSAPWSEVLILSEGPARRTTNEAHGLALLLGTAQTAIRVGAASMCPCNLQQLQFVTWFVTDQCCIPENVLLTFMSSYYQTKSLTLSNIVVNIRTICCNTKKLFFFFAHTVYVGVFISLWLFLFAALFLDGLKKLEQRSHKRLELRGEYVE